MINDKTEFIRTFLPSKIDDVNYAHINLDIFDLSVADILRNVNKTYPKNSRDRNAIASGNLAVAVLCKTETLSPLSGILFIITDDVNMVDVVSKNYIVLSISESNIVDDDHIRIVIDRITNGLLKGFKDSFKDFNAFYVKYLYDQYEMEMDDD